MKANCSPMAIAQLTRHFPGQTCPVHLDCDRPPDPFGIRDDFAIVSREQARRTGPSHTEQQHHDEPRETDCRMALRLLSVPPRAALRATISRSAQQQHPAT
jgi:hypothetical protein